MTKPERTLIFEDARQIEEILRYLENGQIVNLADLRNSAKEANTCKLLLPSSDPDSTKLEWRKVSTDSFFTALQEFDGRTSRDAGASKSLFKKITDRLIGWASEAK